MKALRGLSRADTLRLVEIEYYIKTGHRVDDLQVTDEWISDSMRFLSGELRPTLEAWGELGDLVNKEQPAAIEARKLYRALKRGVRGNTLSKTLRAFVESMDETESRPR